MNQTQSEVFTLLDAHRNDPGQMIDQMIDFFRESGRPMELFEALKMRTRHKLGLPLVNSDVEPPRPEEVERQLEMGLLEACREAGTMLLKQGKVGEGWMYLRPTGDLQLAKELLAEIEIDDDNYDEMIQVLLHEGIDVGRGYQAVLDHQGTCNSITLYEQSLAGRGKLERRAAAAKLLDHLYDELVAMVRGDISRREAPADESESLVDMLNKRKWLLEDGGYHLDTTHISSTVKIATILEEEDQLRKAWELTQYGRRLHHQFQYTGDEPFVDFYPAHAAFFSILRGENVDAGLKVFERKARSVNVAEHGTGAMETYIDLLDRVGRHREAVESAIDLVPDDLPPQRIVPLLIDIAGRETSSDENREAAFSAIAEYCKKHDDVLGYAAVMNGFRS